MDNFYESIYSNNSEEFNQPVVISDYVNNLVEPICKEFQTIILNHGEEIIKNLMPMVGSCLDTLNRIYSEKHNIEVEFELLKEDSTELMTQYEREKTMRRKADENLFKSEDLLAEKMSKYEDQILSMESQLKMSDIRIKNLQDHINRLEDREIERKAELDKVNVRYKELIKNHMDMLEKTRPSQQWKDVPMSAKRHHMESTDIDVDNRAAEDDLYSTSQSLSLTESPQYLRVGHRDSMSDLSEEELTTHNYQENNLQHHGMAFSEDLAGMTQEIEGIIKENTELTATKNALNVVKDDLIAKLDEANSEIELLQHENRTINQHKISMKLKINELESENKSIKHELTTVQQKLDCNMEDDNVPISQRKRFTRLEMARILMERNQYKEKLNELEEYLKWIRLMNSKEKKVSIWEKFSRFFRSEKQNDNIITRLNEHKRLQQKIMAKTHVSSECMALKDTNRYQACGWSLPNKEVDPLTLNIPVPIYCRPLHENQFDFKICCATTVDIISGKSLSGDTYIGESIFYDSQFETVHKTEDEIHLDNQLKQAAAINKFGRTRIDSSNIFESHIWIATCSSYQSQIIIIDANRPAQTLDTFLIPDSMVICMSSIPGASETDYIKKESVTKQIIRNKQLEIPSYHIETVTCLNHTSFARETGISTATNNTQPDSATTNTEEEDDEDKAASTSTAEAAVGNSSSAILLQSTVWIGCSDGNLYIHPVSSNKSHCLNHVKLPDAITNIKFQNSRVFISLANGSVIVFSRYSPSGVSSASNGQSTSTISLVGQWNLSEYQQLAFQDTMLEKCSIRFMECVTFNNALWLAYKNQIVVINDFSCKPVVRFEAHPKPEYHIKQMAWAGDGVWISLRLDAILRLFHAFTYQHLQDINIEPHINKLIEPSLLGLSLLRITSLSTINNSLWIGINNGVIICAPFLRESNEFNFHTIGTFIEPTDQQSEENVHPTFVPFINAEDLQLSYHGHVESVKFFTNVYRNYVKSENTNLKFKKLLVISGGEGYKDFRLKENNPSLQMLTTTSAATIARNGSKPRDFNSVTNTSTIDDSETNNGCHSHSYLIVWQCN